VRVEVLFVPGCPNYEPAVERVRKVLAEEAINVDVHGIAVNTDEDATSLLFPGSPTIRVNGEDVEPNGMNASGLSCRLYSNRTGIPSEEVVRNAVVNARLRSNSR
jgi:hypothetical protein